MYKHSEMLLVANTGTPDEILNCPQERKNSRKKT